MTSTLPGLTARTGGRWRRGLAVAATAAVTALISACGVTGSSVPDDVGDALGANDNSGLAIQPPKPSSFTTPEGLVEGFFKAATGGGKAAVDNVMAFFTEPAQESWKQPPEENLDVLTVIRITKIERNGQENGRQKVSIEYREVGKLSTDKGRLDPLTQPAAHPKTATFVVSYRSATGGWRIDGIAGSTLMSGGLFVSDAGLRDLYRIQPIYFWDRDGNRLVPDLRYIPRTVNQAVGATMIVNMLVAGPSSLVDGSQPLRLGAATDGNVVDDNATLVVSMNPKALPQDDKQPAAAERLVRQLQWSLSIDGIAPAIRLKSSGKTWSKDRSDLSYRPFNEATQLAEPAHTFDIRAEKVVAVSETGTELPELRVLAVKENRSVVAAAVSRDLNQGAFVTRLAGGLRELHITRVGAKATAVKLRSYDLGRPAWVPNSLFVLVPSGGRLMVVSANTGSYQQLAVPTSLGAITAVSVAPDAQRIALVAAGRVYVAQLGVQSAAITIEASPIGLPISANLVATGVAWSSEVWLRVVGSEAEASVMYEVTADSAVAVRTELKGYAPIGVVAYPSPNRSNLAVYVLGAQAAYSAGQSETGFKAPFFAL